MDSTAGRARRILESTAGRALPLSEMRRRLAREEPLHLPADPVLLHRLERAPGELRLVDPLRGPWRMGGRPGSAVDAAAMVDRSSLVEPWVLAVQGEDPDRRSRGLDRAGRVRTDAGLLDAQERSGSPTPRGASLLDLRLRQTLARLTQRADLDSATGVLRWIRVTEEGRRVAARLRGDQIRRGGEARDRE